MKRGLVVVGLGPGDPGDMSAGALRALQEAEFVILRTSTHPTVAFLEEQGITYTSCDDIYESAPTFGAAYEQIVDRVMQAALSGICVAYAVPGHPSVFEDTVSRLRARCVEAGVQFTIAGSQSFLEPAFASLGIDPAHGLLVLDALNLKAEQLSRTTPTLIVQVYDRTVASDVKLVLASRYGDEHTVNVVRAAGVRGEQRTSEVRVFELDRLSWLDHLTTVYVPPLETSATGRTRGTQPAETHPAITQPTAPQPAETRRAESQRICRYPADPLVDVVARLRGEGGCPWDREQDHMSLRPFVLEEAYEVVESIELGEMNKLCEELGDLLLQIALHAQIAAEEGSFDINDVVSGITEKMVRRHPHVFAGTRVRDSSEVLDRWQEIKDAEHDKMEPSVIGQVPKHLPALMRAHEVQHRAAKVGFDWPAPRDIFDKVAEEIQELKKAHEANDSGALEGELGDLLFSVTNLARRFGVMPEQALATTVNKFVRRFRFIEDAARVQGRDMKHMTLGEMDALWDQAKKLGL
jgi:tetrapyrrole methylase family protein/MazG family protein